MSASRLFRVQLTMHIHPGAEQEFEETWLRIGEAVTGHPANRGQWLARSAQHAGTYVITSDWTDESRFREFERGDRHLAHRAMLHPLRSGGSMTTMYVLHHLPGSEQ